MIMLYALKHWPMRYLSRILPSTVVAIVCLSFMSCDRPTLRKLINRFGAEKKEKPEVYHEFQGYSPGLRRSRVEEDFSRYHYYIATDPDDFDDIEPDIYFRQDYETYDEPDIQFDEEAYWREHPIQIDGQPDIPDVASELQNNE